MNTRLLKQIPNAISVLRIVLVIPIIASIWQEEYKLTFVLIFVAGVSDGVDGFLARFFNWKTTLGAILDPLADKILLVSLFVVFALKDLLPMWLMYLVVGRDAIVLVGALAYHYLTHQLEMRPLFISKINTALQIVLVLLIALKLAAIHVAPWILDTFITLVVLSTLLSGISYVIQWTRFTLRLQKDSK